MSILTYEREDNHPYLVSSNQLRIVVEHTPPGRTLAKRATAYRDKINEAEVLCCLAN
jgi:hypothetical protein